MSYEIALEKSGFDYSQLDFETAKKLQTLERENFKDGMKYLTKVGERLKEGNSILAKNGYGCFQEWALLSHGIRKDKAYSLIHRYNLIVGNSDKQEYIESLPVTLIDEIVRESTPEVLKDMVLEGKITTRRDFLKAEARLEDKSKINDVFDDIEPEIIDSFISVVNRRNDVIPDFTSDSELNERLSIHTNGIRKIAIDFILRVGKILSEVSIDQWKYLSYSDEQQTEIVNLYHELKGE